jgi:hypothetical protein
MSRFFRNYKLYLDLRSRIVKKSRFQSRLISSKISGKSFGSTKISRKRNNKVVFKENKNFAKRIVASSKS